MTITWQDKVKDALERAASSAGQQFLSVIALMHVVHLAGLPWAYALSTAGGAAVVSILLTVGQYAIGANVLPFWADALVRAGKTFAASLLASLGGGVVDLANVSWASALDIAALAALLAYIKSFVAPNAHMSGSFLSAPTAARVAKAELTGNQFHK